MKVYGEVHRDGKLVGSEAICHNMVIEQLALPGQLVMGTDSHTCMAGALGCFAFGVGSTDMANAWLTRDVRVTVPQTARFELRGKLRPGVCAKDVMLHLLSQPFFKSSDGIGKVLEFAGDGIAHLPLDERATLTNMAVEAGGFTGIIEADEVVVDYLVKQRGANADDVRRRFVKADPGAEYCATFEVDLGSIVPMVATPGDPRNGIPLGQLGARREDRHRVRRLVHRRQEGRHGHVRAGPGRRRDARASASRPGCTSTCSSARRTSAATPRRRAT